MIIKTIPRIAPGSILRQTALTAISDAAFMTNEYLIREYADGILSGCGLETTEDAIIVKEGTVFLDKEIFLIKKPLTINYSPTNTTVVLKMCFPMQYLMITVFTAIWIWKLLERQLVSLDR